jgi:hypothetical protein
VNNFNNNQLFYYIEYEGGCYRCYDERNVSPEQMFYSETAIRFDLLQQLGYTFYIIYMKSKKNIQLNNEDIKYISLNPESDERLNQPLDYKFTDNIAFLKNNKYIDLDYFHKQLCIDFIFLVLKKTNDNYFFYDLILGTKTKFDFSILENFNSNLVIVDRIVPMSQFSVNMNFIKNFFQIENTIFKDHCLTKAEVEAWTNWTKISKSQEYLEREAFYKEWLKVEGREHYNPIYLEKKKYFNDRVSQREKIERDYLFYKQTVFKKLCSIILYYDKNYDCYFDKEKNDYFIKPSFRTFTNFNELINAKFIVFENGELKLKSNPFELPYIDLLVDNIIFLNIDYVHFKKGR